MIDGKNVLVTGGAGFIGSHLVDFLIGRDCRVKVIDDLSTGSLENLGYAKNSGRLEVIAKSIFDLAAIQDHFLGVDYVFHLACRNVRLSLRQPTIVHDINTTGSLNVLKAAANARVKKFLYCSSSEVNGTADVVPMKEDYHYKPETIYGASKLIGEYYTSVFHRSGWLDTVIARPHNNYGPREHFKGDSGEVIPRFIIWSFADLTLNVFGDGLQTRDFTFVNDTVKYLVRLMEHQGSSGEIYNVCRGQEISILDVARSIIENIGSGRIAHLPERPHDVKRLYGDPTKLKALIGDSPSVGFQEGIQTTIAWFKENVSVTEELLDALEPMNWEHSDFEAWLPRP